MNKLHNLKSQDFVNLDMEPESFRSLGYMVIDEIADYYRTIRDRSIVSAESSESIEKQFADPLPIHGEDPAGIIEDWQNRILPHATHLGSPRYFGFVNGSGSMISVFADAFATALNMNAGGWKAGPAATEIERRTIGWIAELINYSPDCGGLFLGGGTIANFAALLTALRNIADYDTTIDGLQSDTRKGKFTIYMSDHEGHVSIVKAADMLNLGREAVRRVPSHEDFTINIQALRQMIEIDRSNGKIPFCVVAQVGSINIGAIDPLKDIAEICREEGIWFHADGACGAVGAMLPELADRYEGLAFADSVTLDPHKWLYIPYECGCLLVKDADKLRRSFSTNAPYLQGSLPSEYNGLNYFDYGPQMSRGFDALKVWMTIRHYGREGYRQLLRQNIQCAAYLHQLVSESEDFTTLHEPLLFIYSFRFFPVALRQLAQPGLHNYLDELNQRIADEITASGFAFIMTTKINNRVVIRLSICSHRTTLKDIKEVFERLRQIGNKLLDSGPFNPR